MMQNYSIKLVYKEIDLLKSMIRALSTYPVIFNPFDCFLAKIDKSVVLPAPDAPIIAKVLPGVQYPLILLRICFPFI